MILDQLSAKRGGREDGNPVERVFLGEVFRRPLADDVRGNRADGVRKTGVDRERDIVDRGSPFVEDELVVRACARHLRKKGIEKRVLRKD